MDAYCGEITNHILHKIGHRKNDVTCVGTLFFALRIVQNSKIKKINNLFIKCYLHN